MGTRFSVTRKSAFSLIELSIVLVILGLLTGGILAGQSLIKAAEIRGIITETTRYSTASNAFRDKYLGLPGDFKDATRFWGLSSTASGCISNSGAASSASGTCDGDGAGTVASTSATTDGLSVEEYQFWRHLALAGLIEGGYTGVYNGTGTVGALAGLNVPPTKRSPGFWRVYNGGDLTGTVTGTSTSTFALIYSNTLWGTISNGSFLLKPEELWNIDTKLDDGLPARGYIIARPWSSCTDAADRTILSANYALSTSDSVCSIVRRQLF